MFSLVRMVRAAATVAVLLLVSGTIPASPAIAAPVRSGTTSWLYTTTHAVYPYPEVPGWPGESTAKPADAGPAPGSVTMVVQATNEGSEPLRDVSVTTKSRPNGHIDSIRCATTPPTSDDAERAAAPDDPPKPEMQRRHPAQREASKSRSPQASSTSGTPSSWTDPAVVLAPDQTLYCSILISGITDDVVHEDDTDVTATGADSGEQVIGSTYAYLASGALRPPPPGPISVGNLAWVDLNQNNIQQIDWGEPGLPGLHVKIAGPDGLPPHSYPTGVGVVDPQVTSRTGTYRFRNLRPFTTYTLTLDLTSPSLANLVKSPSSPGEVSADRSTWSMKIDTGSYDLNHVGTFGFVARDPLKVTVNAPATAVAGTRVQVVGGAWRPGPGGAWDGHAILEFQPAGTTDFATWTKVGDATSRQGKLTTAATAVRSGWYRYRVPGDASTAPAISRPDHLTVATAPVVLTATAPASVRQGTALTVTGTITRAGTPFRTGRISLEYSTDSGTWTTVTDVRSTDGTLTATLPARTGYYRYHYLGDSRTATGTSPTRHVVVS